MAKYGLISELDARCIEKTIDCICEKLDGTINITEIGLYNCETSKGIYDYTFETHKVRINYTGIDNQKDKEIIAPDWMNLIIGNSNEVYNQLEDQSQHVIFVDGNHSFQAVISDFFCYAPKIKQGGYFLFHDTGEHISPFKDYQGFGSLTDQDMYISVRKALTKIGLLDDTFKFLGEKYYRSNLLQWELIFDEADKNNEAGGICVFKKK